MLCKKHEAGGNSVLACCDRELLGKTISDKEIELHISEAFYGGNPVNEKELAEMLHEYGNINLAGNRCVSVAIKEGLISERGVIKINSTMHAIIMRL